MQGVTERLEAAERKKLSLLQVDLTPTPFLTRARTRTRTRTRTLSRWCRWTSLCV